MKSTLERHMSFLLKLHNLPTMEMEHKFHPTRKWRFDFAYPEHKIAVEVEGGIWIAGRHSRGAGMVRDMEKYNSAVLLGWKVLRYATNNLAQAPEDIKTLLEAK